MGTFALSQYPTFYTVSADDQLIGFADCTDRFNVRPGITLDCNSNVMGEHDH